ncbi:hypothetical protein F4680DRAFT_465778 [Xylaria scruposa]|nr:hypothetical protein F4680DRAFT_465778 [Xylaria scruposa]
MGLIAIELTYGRNPSKFARNPWQPGAEHGNTRPAFHQEYQKAIDMLSKNYRQYVGQKTAKRNPPFIHFGDMIVQMLRHKVALPSRSPPSCPELSSPRYNRFSPPLLLAFDLLALLELVIAQVEVIDSLGAVIQVLGSYDALHSPLTVFMGLLPAQDKVYVSYLWRLREAFYRLPGGTQYTQQRRDVIVDKLNTFTLSIWLNGQKEITKWFRNLTPLANAVYGHRQAPNIERFSADWNMEEAVLVCVRHDHYRAEDQQHSRSHGTASDTKANSEPTAANAALETTPRKAKIGKPS